ncbi:HTH domain-containing protein [bacterium]|nr:HTH domain-containing protein [bacterium]
MPFERSLEIERRLEDVLRLIRTGRYSTPMLAEEIGVSIPTISRCVTALRARGHDIRAERHEDGWRYVLAGQQDPGKGGTDRPGDKPRKVSRLSGHDD